MNISRRWVFWVFFLGLTGLTAFLSAEPPPQWKDFQDNRVGVKLRVNREWQLVTVNESPQTGMVAFNIYTPGHVSVAITRQKWDDPFSQWTSTETLSQLFAPGYKTSKTEFAGRSSVRVIGSDHDGRRQEAYYSSRPPFVDDITFVANEDQWDHYQKIFDEIKKSIHWTR